MLTPILQAGAQRMLAVAIEAEAQAWIDERATLVDEHGHRLVVRNGHQPVRTIQTGIGNLEVHRPRIHDRRPPEVRPPEERPPEERPPESRSSEGRSPNCRESFTSSILPPYLRRTKSIEELIPWLYLKGISTGGFAEALQSLVGPPSGGGSGAVGLDGEPPDPGLAG